jgi:type I restriction enzyme M protein
MPGTPSPPPPQFRTPSAAAVLDDKWQATVISRIVSEVDSLARSLVGRIQELGDRYTVTLAELDEKLSSIEQRVTSHLAAMGVEK